MRMLILISCLFGVPAAAAQLPRSNVAPAVEVELSDFQFSPRSIHLRSGDRVVVLLANRTGSGHNFSAPEFFAAAQVDPASMSHVQHGTVEVPKHSTVAIVLVPAAGRFLLKCSHPLHSTLGMKGVIVVE
jgi:uncharacterized cupredoxin-like copper-binding protein